MYCFHPILVRQWYEDKKGIKKQSKSYHQVPCGKCVACLARKRNEWTYRLSMEQQMSDYTFFATLTYDDKNCPVKIKDGKPYLVFSVSDVQKYMKRVRYFIDQIDKNIVTSYYLTSEYGGIGHRPHYHFLFYVKGDNYLRHKKQIDMILRNTWEKGFVTFKPANDANIHYVTKYCVKDLETMPSDCIDPVFILVSKRPYLGSSFEPTLEKQINFSPGYEAKVFIHGMPNAMPRIYRQKLGAAACRAKPSIYCDFLTGDTEQKYYSEWRRSHSYFSVPEFINFCWAKVKRVEKDATRRQLKRNEKL